MNREALGEGNLGTIHKKNGTKMPLSDKLSINQYKENNPKLEKTVEHNKPLGSAKDIN